METRDKNNAAERNWKHLTWRVFFPIRVFRCFGYWQRQSPQKTLVNRHRDRAYLQASCGPPKDAVLISCGLGDRIFDLNHFLEAHFAFLPAFGRGTGCASQNSIANRSLSNIMGVVVFWRPVPGILIEQSLQTLELSILGTKKDQPQIKPMPSREQLEFEMAAPWRMSVKWNFAATAWRTFRMRKQLTVGSHNTMHTPSTLFCEEGSHSISWPTFPELSYPEMIKWWKCFHG